MLVETLACTIVQTFHILSIYYLAVFVNNSNAIYAFCMQNKPVCCLSSTEHAQSKFNSIFLMTLPPVCTDQYTMQICQTITNLKNLMCHAEKDFECHKIFKMFSLITSHHNYCKFA